PSNSEPTGLPFFSIRLPFAWLGKAACATAVTTTGYTTPVTTVNAANNTSTGRKIFVMTINPGKLKRGPSCRKEAGYIKLAYYPAKALLGSGPAKRSQNHVNELDERERQQDTAEAIHQQIAAQERSRAQRPVFHALQRQRNQHHDDQRVKNHGGQDGRRRRCQMHDVEHAQLRISRR